MADFSLGILTTSAIGTTTNPFYHQTTPPPSPEPQEISRRPGRNTMQKRYTHQRSIQRNPQPIPDNYGSLGGPSRRSRSTNPQGDFQGDRKNQVRT